MGEKSALDKNPKEHCHPKDKEVLKEDQEVAREVQRKPRQKNITEAKATVFPEEGRESG